jgi:hypothetical protein
MYLSTEQRLIMLYKTFRFCYVHVEQATLNDVKKRLPSGQQINATRPCVLYLFAH